MNEHADLFISLTLRLGFNVVLVYIGWKHNRTDVMTLGFLAVLRGIAAFEGMDNLAFILLTPITAGYGAYVVYNLIRELERKQRG